MTATRATYAPPSLGEPWYGFGHQLAGTRYRHTCTACGAHILEGSTAHTWVMPMMVDAYPQEPDEDWMVHQATTEYRESLTRCYECLHCYVAARTANTEGGDQS